MIYFTLRNYLMTSKLRAINYHDLRLHAKLGSYWMKAKKEAGLRKIYLFGNISHFSTYF